MFSTCSYSSSVLFETASFAILQDVGNVTFQELEFHSTFTGKERDSETGYFYFRARYYDSGIPNIFLSVDPMADKYPSISPYAYCTWNPVKLVDSDGEEIDDYFSKEGKYLGSDNAETNNVRVIDEALWNQYSNGSGQIDHEVGQSNSSILSESNISNKATLNIYKYYWGKTNSKNSDAIICIEDRPDQMGIHLMDAKTSTKSTRNIATGKVSESNKRIIYIDLNVMSNKKYSDNAFDIISCFEHEDRHLFQHSNPFQVIYGENEYDALKAQVNSPTFKNCSSNFQKEIRNKLEIHTPSYIKRICPDLF